MKAIRNVPLLLIPLLMGCAPRILPLNLPENHPASPSGVIAENYGHSTTLDVAASDPIAREDEMVSSRQEDSHGGPVSAEEKGGGLFACPMHPEITSSDPQKRCPKCGMKINKPVTKAVTSKEGDAHQGHQGHHQ
jgi:hypothetical protein